MQGLENILEKISGIIWGNYLIITLIGVGLFFTILTKGIQIKGFPLAVRELINSLKGEKEVKGEGTLSSFQALCTALSSCPQYIALCASFPPGFPPFLLITLSTALFLSLASTSVRIIFSFSKGFTMKSAAPSLMPVTASWMSA